MSSLKVKYSFLASTVESIWLVKLGGLSANGISFSSWQISLVVKVYVPGIMDLVADMYTESRGKSISIPSGFFTIWYLYWPCLILLSPQVQISTYSSTRQVCEGITCPSTLFEDKFSEF